MKNRRALLTTLLISGISLFCRAQDSLFTTDGKIAAVKITEVNADDIKYRKASNPDGPVYTAGKNTILRIKYKNGEEESYVTPEPVVNPSGVIPVVHKSRLSNYEMTARGRKVYMDIPDDELANLKNELKNELTEWDYWQIVRSKDEADFFLEVTTIKKNANILTNTEVTSKAVVKTPDGEVMWTSESYSSYASMYNGYNALHASVKRLVKNGLKKKFNG